VALNELYFEVFLAILCINGGILIVDALQDTPLKTPFDTTVNVVGLIDTPSEIGNFTAGHGITLVGNITNQTFENSTVFEDDPFQVERADPFAGLIITWNMLSFMAGGFAINVVDLLGFPAIFIYVVDGILALMFVRMVIYFVFGR
jgi:hypothetical protein